jgi:hypothetical protein
MRKAVELAGIKPVATPLTCRHHEPVAHISDTATLWRPTGPEELALVEASGWREWPPRLPGQPIFYPVLNEDYAAMIACDWNVSRSGVGYVTRFQVLRSFLDRYEVRQVGGRPSSNTGSQPTISPP